MSATTATNRVILPEQARSQHYAGITVNAAIPVAAMETWRREAIQKVIAFADLPQNWDEHGSLAPSRAVRQTAIDLLQKVPDEPIAGPSIVPVSGGGLHFEWSAGNRELEISIGPDCRLEALRVEHGMPIEDEAAMELSALFRWLISQ